MEPLMLLMKSAICLGHIDSVPWSSYFPFPGFSNLYVFDKRNIKLLCLILLPLGTNAQGCSWPSATFLLKLKTRELHWISCYFAVSFVFTRKRLQLRFLRVPKSCRNTFMAEILFYPKSPPKEWIQRIFFSEHAVKILPLLSYWRWGTAVKFAEILMFFNSDTGWSKFCYFRGLLAL